MLAEKTLTPQTIEMRLVESEDKLKQNLLSEEEIAALEKLAIPGVFDSETNQRWFGNCGGCGRCFGCGRCYGCGRCVGCGRCGYGLGLSVIEDTADSGFGY